MKEARLEDPGISFRFCASESENCEMKLVKPKYAHLSLANSGTCAENLNKFCLALKIVLNDFICHIES